MRRNRAPLIAGMLVWILWTRLQPIHPIGPDATLAMLGIWQPMRAFATQAECERAAEQPAALAATLLEEYQIKAEVRPAVRCLPDTIDPRTPTPAPVSPPGRP